METRDWGWWTGPRGMGDEDGDGGRGTQRVGRSRRGTNCRHFRQGTEKRMCVPLKFGVDKTSMLCVVVVFGSVLCPVFCVLCFVPLPVCSAP